MPAHPLNVGAGVAAAGAAAGVAVTFFNRGKKGAAKAGARNHDTRRSGEIAWINCNF